MQGEKWYQKKAQAVLEELKSRSGGLTSKEVKARQEEYGKNQLPKDKPLPALKIVLQQLKSPLVYVLLAAAGLSAFINEWFDFSIIIVVVVVNTIVGFWQEYKADRAILKLRELVKHYVTVKRDGSQKQITSEELVSGDIILLSAGDRVAADARILQENELEINEASLTGESFPVKKSVKTLGKEVTVGDRNNMVFMGTTVTAGNCQAIVVATGINTQIGQIADIVSQTKEEVTPLQFQLKKISRFLTWLVLVVVFIIAVVGFFRDLPLTEIFIVTAAIAVAAIPEGLLVALTVVLVIGMQRILKQRALVRKLQAAETLGSVNIICSDKTGTLTKGVMQVDEIIGPKSKILKAVALCNNAYIKNPQAKLEDWELVGDPTETALLLGALQSGLEKENLTKDYGRLDEIPFNETYKFMATLHHSKEKKHFVFVKGAPEIVLKMSDLSTKERNKQKKIVEEMLKQGLRVLAVAQSVHPKKIDSFDQIVDNVEKPSLKKLDFLGFVGLKDPVREDVRDAFQIIGQAGVRSVIITGDHKYTTQAIVQELGLNVTEDEIMEGDELEKLSDSELERRVRSIDIFARVEPKHKLRIIRAWQKHKATVAMFGDGVNDAPALKAADIGVVVDSGTDIAKETADMILLDNNFGVIKSAIEQGRIIFDNIRKIFLYLISDSFSEAIIITIALLFGLPLPITAIQILWINIVSDGLLHLALTMEPGEKDVMELPPRKKTESIINKEVKVLVIAISLTAVTFVFGRYLYFLFLGTQSIEYIRTIVFTAFAVDSTIYVLSVKSLRKPIWRINIFNNKWLIVAMAMSLMLQFAVVYIPFLQPFFKTQPIGLNDWFIIFGLTAVEIVVIESIKFFYWRKKYAKS